MSAKHQVLSLVLMAVLANAVPLPNNTNLQKNMDDPRENATVDYRLPKHVKPLNYTIELIPNIVPGDFTFTGESDINITVESMTYKIVLHAKNLNITYADIKKLPDSTTIDNLKITTSLDEKTDFLVISFNESIIPGDYELSLKYSGLLNEDLSGFYRSSYINHRGEEVWLATTQFEPTYARQAFPCFDEPAYKATFDIRIQHLENYTAISNMPASSKFRSSDYTKWWTCFETTPPMSTYLVAFIVSDFKYIMNDDGRFRVYAPDHLLQHGEYAHRIGQQELKHLEDYTGIKHAIPKMDNFAIPQFRAGAMENWGIVTYRESALLFEENVTTIESKQGIATVVSHEFAHQWFGNLVSPAWWDYTWLNEGFANYFQYFITDKVEDKWRLMEQFVIKNLQETAFVADDNETQHAMDAKVNSPSEISQIFDSISYSKAGSVIRMISHVLGESEFQKGLQTYLTANALSTATSDQLFTAFIKVASTDATLSSNMKPFLESFARQAGYPVVTVIRNHTAGDAQITQKRFLTKKTVVPSELWTIPLNWFIEGDGRNFSETKPMLWLPSANKTTLQTGLVSDKWVIFNTQQTGYYRVNYDTRNWQLIAEYLKNPNNTDKIHVLNRAQLLDDSFNLAQAGELDDHEVFLEITKYLAHENDYVPWYAAYRAFSVLNKALVNTEDYDLFKLYVLRLLKSLETTVGYSETPEDDHIMKLNRLNAVRLACTLGSTGCLAATHDKLVEHVAGSKKTSTDLRNVVLCAGMRSANSTIWKTTFNLTASMRKNSSERSTFVSALGCVSNPEILKRFLNYSLSTESDFSRSEVVKAVYDGSGAGIDIAFDFIRNNSKYLLEELDADYKPTLSYLNAIAGRMTNAAQVDKLEKYIESLPETNKEFAEALKKGALDKARSNIEWLNKYQPKITMFLKSQKLVSDGEKGEQGSSNISIPSFALILFTALGASVMTKMF